METKKISFGFSKINKKPNLLPSKVPKEENKVELIKCVEGQAIKLVEEKPEEAPLIIPLKHQGKTSAALASLIRRRAVLLGEDEPVAEELQPEPENVLSANVAPAPPETLEARAARELLAELQSANGEAVDTPNLVLPVVHPDELPLDGAKESTMHDYESVPIQQYGLAMLRGMGWVEPPKKKGANGVLVEEAPFVRPKGMGLGADKALKKQPLLVAPEANEVLEIKKQAFVRIIGGKHKDLYGQIEGFDDHGARVIVKMAIGGAKEAFNEFLCQAVSRKEFAQYGKCINTAKYEEFKKMENEHGQIIIKEEKAQKPIKKEPTERRHEEKMFEKCEPKSDEEKYKASRRKDDNYENERKPYEESARKYQGKEESFEDRKYEKRQPKIENEIYKDSRRRDDNYEKERKPRDESARKYNDERRKSPTSSARRRYEDDRYSQSSSREAARSNRDEYERREKRRSRSTERRDHQKTSASSSSSRRRHSSGTSKSSADSESDSEESDHKRKHKKKSSHKSKSKKHAKKSKSKSKRRSDDSDSDSDEACSSHNKSHKKKTKKSKKQRSRSRSPRGRR